MNCLSVLQYAVEVLRVRHVMVVGHYGCGGVRAAMDSQRHGLIDNWLRHIRDVYHQYRHLLGPWKDSPTQNDRLCELNVIEQAYNVCNTTIVQDAWARGQELSVHGWVYSLANGRLTDLDFCVSGQEQINTQYEVAVTRVKRLAQG